MSQLNAKITIEDGAMWATVDEFPGVFATGDTLDELRASLEEGIALYLAEPGEPAPRVSVGNLELGGAVSASADLEYA